MELASKLCSLVVSNGKKERFEIILEPFQAITQLAMLSFCPPGSKLSITDNVLYIQIPTWHQPLERSYYSDKRDDLFYLFKMITRFNKFYSYFKSESGYLPQLFVLLTELSKSGIDVIIQTYSNSGNETLLHTLKMYRTMLEKPDLLSSHNDSIHSVSSGCKDIENIDDVFINITQIYKQTHFNAVYNILLLAQQNPDDYNSYIKCLHNLLYPTHVIIKKWIHENIVF